MPSDPSGPWSFEVVIPPTVVPGERALQVRCGATLFPPVRFTVLPGEVATLGVSPLVVRVGSGDVTLSVSGNVCRARPGTRTEVLVRADEVIGPDPALQGVGRTVVATDENGEWSAEFTIETDHPALFFVRARCQIGDGQELLWDYLGGSVRVLAATDGNSFTG